MIRNMTVAGEGKSSLLITGDDIPFGAYQAIYHKLTKRIETEQKIYSNAYDIYVGDLNNLNDRLFQIVKQYQVKALRCEITHSIKGDSTRQHSSFERFKMSDCSMRSCTTSINYELDFLIILPPEVTEASEIAQRYKISILIDQDFIDSDDYDAPYFMRNMILGKNIILSIEYADYSVYKTLSSAVDGWIDTLPIRKPSGLMNVAKRFERGITNNAPNISRAGAYAGGAFYAYRHGFLNPANAAVVVITATGIAVSGSIFCSYLIEVFYKLATKFKPSTRLHITAGDEQRIVKMEIEKRKLRTLTTFIVIAILLTMFLNISSNFIYDAIK